MWTGALTGYGLGWDLADDATATDSDVFHVRVGWTK